MNNEHFTKIVLKEAQKALLCGEFLGLVELIG